MFLALVAGQWCWDPVPGADRYTLYAAGLADPTIYTCVDDGGEYECWDNAPAGFACSDWASSESCDSGSCCAPFLDEPGRLVFYTLTAEDSTAPGSESVPDPPLPLEVCP